jgi:hypothetical protein
LPSSTSTVALSTVRRGGLSTSTTKSEARHDRILCSCKLRLRRASPTLGLPSVHRALLGLRRLHAGGAKTLELQRPCCGAVFSAARRQKRRKGWSRWHERTDGGIVDAEIIRPRSWILASGLCAGRMLPLNLPELEVSGLALVTAIEDCPPIASGEGSVVTARFVTREVHVVASVDVLGADGTVETITGTTIHPVWSVDRQSWVPLAELTDGETLQGLDGLAVVLSVALSRVSQPVYNIEVHGEHVYQVGELGVLVHNVKSSILNQSYSLRLKSSRASVLSANRKVYNDFLENGGKLIVKRDLIKFGDDGAQILGEFNSVNKTITLFRGSNLSCFAPAEFGVLI